MMADEMVWVIEVKTDMSVGVCSDIDIQKNALAGQRTNVFFFLRLYFPRWTYAQEVCMVGLLTGLPPT